MNREQKLKGIDPLIMFEQVWTNKKKLLLIICIGVVVGLIVSWSIPTAYTTTIKIVPDQSTIDNSNFISDIVKSKPFLLNFWSLEVSMLDKSKILLRNYILNEYKFPWWRDIIELPATIQKWRYGKPIFLDTVNLFQLAPEQATFVGRMNKDIKVQMDKRNGVMNLIVRMQDPMVSALVANEILKKMQTLVAEKKTYKANVDVKFYENLLNNARLNYEKKQEDLSKYIASHRESVSSVSTMEQFRLKQDVELVYKPYASMIEELDKAKMKVQEETPTFAIIEPASVPSYPSEPRTLLIILGSVFLFGFFGIIGLLVRGMFK